jgi:hypothetical protein
VLSTDKDPRSHNKWPAATTAVLLSAMAIAGCSSSKGTPEAHPHAKPTPHHSQQQFNLTPTQETQLNKAAKFGAFGLAGYQKILGDFADAKVQLRKKYPAISSGEIPTIIPEGPHGQSVGAPLKLGETIKAEDFFSLGTDYEYTFTPSASQTGTSVTFTSDASALLSANHRTMTFTNPDKNYFKDDYASQTEVASFFNTPSTRLSALTDSELWIDYLKPKSYTSGYQMSLPDQGQDIIVTPDNTENKTFGLHNSENQTISFANNKEILDEISNFEYY